MVLLKINLYVDLKKQNNLNSTLKSVFCYDIIKRNEKNAKDRNQFFPDLLKLLYVFL